MHTNLISFKNINIPLIVSLELFCAKKTPTTPNWPFQKYLPPYNGGRQELVAGEFFHSPSGKSGKMLQYTGKALFWETETSHIGGKHAITCISLIMQAHTKLSLDELH